MKNRVLIITTIIFFLLVNTTYYWEGNLGIIAMPEALIMVLIFIGLIIALLIQLFVLFRERFKDRQRIFVVVLLTSVLVLTIFYPNGFVNFDKFEGDDILIAQGEGAANCRTTFKLKVNSKFKERIVCFGITEIRGNYKLRNDTIFFENVELGRHVKDYYKFALIKPSRFDKDKKSFDLVRYNDKDDSTGHELWITKNEMNK